jgi:hypothetical protein
VGAITRSDEGNRRCPLGGYRWAVGQCVHALVNCRIGAGVEEGIAAYVNIFVVDGLCLLVAEGAGCVIGERLETRFLDVAWGAFEPGTDDFSVVGEVDEFGRGWFGFVVKQVDGGLWGALTPSVVGVASGGMA